MRNLPSFATCGYFSLRIVRPEISRDRPKGPRRPVVC